jgi:SAM-dependent methyltransferase
LGVPRGTARLLLDEARARPFSGALLELGRMTVYVTDRALGRWAAEQRAPLAPLAAAELELSHVPALARLGCLSDRAFFRRLGFASVESADLSRWEGADHAVDLNEPVPGSLRGRFDAVFEAGTIQHLFHLPRLFENVHALLRPGGRVIHGMAPSSNHVDHGFHMFSPTLFDDFYRTNGWRIEASFFFEFFPFWHRGRFESTRWKIRRYEPGVLDHLSYGGFRGRQVALFLVATRLPGSTADRIPQQSWFARHAAELAAPAGAAAPLPATWRALDRVLVPLKGVKQRLKRLLPRRLPPVVARY